MGLYLIIVLFFCLYISLLESSYSNAFKNIQSEYFIKIISIREEGDYKDKYIAKVLNGKDKNFKIYYCCGRVPSPLKLSPEGCKYARQSPCAAFTRLDKPAI